MTNINDYALQDRADFLRGTPTRDTARNKLAHAIEWLGERYVFHPANHIQRLRQPLMLERTMEPKVLKVKK